MRKSPATNRPESSATAESARPGAEGALRAARPNEAAADPAAGIVNLSGLGNRFVALFARRLQRNDFAAEIARITLPALRATAVAILGYQPRRDRLLLLAAEGLSPEAQAALGDGDTCAWDIPMRSLRNRRISVIGGAHQNPFVPRALSALAPRGMSIASLPIHHDLEPAGVMLIFLTGNRSFSDAQLQTLSQALRVCASGIRDTDADAARPGAAPIQPENVEATIAKLVAAGAIIDPAAASAALTPPAREAAPTLAAGAAAADDLVVRVQSLERELGRAHEEMETGGRRLRQLTMNNNALARERDGLLQRLSEFESGQGTELAQVRAELDAAQERLLAVEAERARIHRLSEGRNNMAQQSISALEQERVALEARAGNAEAQAAEVQTLLAAVLDERDRLSAQIESLSADLRGKQDSLQRMHSETTQERAALEADRDGWQQEATAARSQLAERSGQLAATERDLRSVSVARDGLNAQLTAARAELERLTVLSDELASTGAQVETARATTAAENASLRRSLDDERAGRISMESDLRAELAAAQREMEQLVGTGHSLRAELGERVRLLAERDLQVSGLRQELDVNRQAAASAQDSIAAMRSDLASLGAQLEQGNIERQQLLDERTALRTSLGELRQRASQGDVAHAAQLGELTAEVDTLRRQLQSAGHDRSSLGERLQRAVEDGHELTRRLADSQRRTDELLAGVHERDARLAEVSAQREQLTAQSAALDGQLRAAQEALERQQQRATLERASFDSQRAAWEDHSGTLQGELGRRSETLVQLERELRTAVVARDNALAEIDELAQDRRVAALQLDSLRESLTQREVERDTAQADLARLRDALESERAARAESERAVRTELTTARAEAERWSTNADAWRKDLEEQSRALHERESSLAELQREAETLRQQRADRDVLAAQASALGQQVVVLEQQLATARAEAARAQDQSATEWEPRLVALEQQLAAVRGEAAQAERQRAALSEELEAARRLQAQGEVVSDRKLATLRDAVDRLTEDRRRLEALNSQRNAEVEAQRANLDELHATLEQLRAERADAQAHGRDLAHQLGDAHRKLEDLGTHLRERDAAVESTVNDRSKLSAQIAKLSAQLRASQAVIESLEGRTALDRASLEAERDRWKEQADAARMQLDTLLASADAVTQDAAQAAAARLAAEAEIEALRRTLENERGAQQSQEDAWRTELASSKAEAETWGRDLASLRAQLAQREEELVKLLQESESSRHSQLSLEQAHSATRSELEATAHRLAATTTELEQVRSERAQLEAQITATQATQGDEVQALSQQLQSSRTRLRAMENEKSLLEAALSEHQQRTRDLAGAHAASVGELQGAADELRKQITELNSGRAQLLQRAQQAEQELGARARQLDDDAQERSVLGERCAQLEQQLAAAETRRAEIGDELARARAEAETLRAASADRGALDEHATELGRRMAEMEQTVATLHGEVTRSERQRAALAEDLDTANRLRAQLVEAAEAEQLRLRERLQQLSDERKRVETLQAQQQTELDTNRSALAELRAALEQTREERLQLEQTSTDLGEQLGGTQRRLDELTAVLRERETALEAAGTDRKRLLEAVRAAEATAEMLATQHGDVPTPADANDLAGIALVQDAPGDEGELVIERSAPLGEALLDAQDASQPLEEVVAEVVVVAEPVRELFLLDTGKRAEEASAVLKGAGFEVNVAAPVVQTVGDLRQRSLSCVMLNLAAGPQAWQTLKALREEEATRNVPILAYLMPPDGSKGFCFGRADFGFWPVDPQQLIAQLGWLKPKLKRLLAVSADVDGMGKLREPLGKANISTSIVLDGKQALEFTTIVAPEAAVLHLSPQTPAIARAIAGIRTPDSAADLPLLLLLDKAPPREDVFLAATVRELLIKGTFAFNKLPAQIGRLIY